MSIPLTEKLIQRQINNWNRFREILQEKPELEKKLHPGPVVTISRKIGSGGRALAETIAERLNMTLQDQSLVDQICANEDLEKSLVAQLDEKKIDQANLWVQGVLRNRIFMKDQYLTALVKAITKLATAGNVVFLGRGANLILGPKATIRVLLIASDETRISRISHKFDINPLKARELMEETDKKRESFVSSVFREDPGQPSNFDLTINTDRITADDVTEIVLLSLLELHANTKNKE